MQRPRPQDGGRHGSPEASSCSPARPRLLDGGRHPVSAPANFIAKLSLAVLGEEKPQLGFV